MPKSKKRPDGRFRSKLYLGTVDGKQQYKYVYGKTQKEVDDKLIELKLSLRKGIDINAGRETFEDWAEQWLSFKKLEISHNSFQNMCCRVDNLQTLFDMPISKIKTSDIQVIINQSATVPNTKTGKPYAKKTIKDIRMVASSIFKLAIENRVIDYNPAEFVKIPNAAEPEKRQALTEAQQGWIISTPHRAQRAAMIMMFAGLRRGEIIALMWSDVDLKNKTITVNKSVEMINGKPIVKNTTKTDAGMRVVHIPQLLADFLKKEKRTSLLVCTSSREKMISKSAWKCMWESYMYDLNLKYGDFSNCIETSGEIPVKFAPTKAPFVIPRFTAHWLRHTFITLMYFAGVDILTAKE
jgi:integrase